MPASLARVGAALALAAVLSACGRAEPPAAPEPPAPRISGTVQVAGLREPVTVARDRWGIPHITAANLDDLFFAQGFVQAQDRLFQIDLWRRSVQGRLSEVLGANFIERDAMTRRVQFRGDLDREWASYGPNTRRIAVAFISGINAWVARARSELPEEFVLAGWQPEFWRPEDLLNRTDAFVSSINASDELYRVRLAAAVGADRVDQLLPVGGGQRTTVEPGVDPSIITYVVPEAIGRVGTPPFFVTLAAPVTAAPRPSQQLAASGPGSKHDPDARRSGGDGAADRRDGAVEGQSVRAGGGSAWVISASRSAAGAPLLAVAPHQPFANPSLRYLVHLNAPGWHVAGATSPWLPGVVIGHNERMAWGMTAADLDTQDVFVERLNPDNPRQVERQGRWTDLSVDLERIDVKGRSRPVVYERMYSSNGPIVALDRQRNLAYTVRWSGTEPGGAGELAALALNQATSWSEFRAALSRWRMPAMEFVYADVDGHIARVTGGLTPARVGAGGAVPSAAWLGARVWRGWLASPGPPAVLEPSNGAVISAGGDLARASRIAQVVGISGTRTLEQMRDLQMDVVASNASLLVPLLKDVGVLPPELVPLRARLLSWNREVRADSGEAGLYVAWEAAIRRLLAAGRVPPEFVPGLAVRLDLVTAMTRPSGVWFDGNPIRARNALLVDALSGLSTRAGAAGTAVTAGATGAAFTFAHPLAVFEESRRRFNIGPFPLPGYRDTVFASDGTSGPPFRALFDLSDWNRSVVINAPGQSGSPASPHYDDLAEKWAAGEYLPFPFDQQTVAAAATDTLTLLPR